MRDFIPHHISAEPADFEGNAGRGRFILLPGSPGRAAEIAEHFSEHRVKPHPRGHDLHLGVLSGPAGAVDVGVVASGMGGPSVEIIVSELLELGARRLLRVGTTGTLQPRVHLGELVIATAAVRDERAGTDYLPLSFPAVASLAMVDRLRGAASALGLSDRTHCGTVHSKDSLYAREFQRGPRGDEHAEFKRLLRSGGVLCSEMECATLFVMGAVAHHEAQQCAPPQAVEVGAVLAVIGGTEEGFGSGDVVPRAIRQAVELALHACTL